MLSLSIMQKIAVYAIPMIFAITVHESAHAWVASRHGDDTARLLGRLSFNPFAHIEILGTIVFPLIGIILGGFIFGWAKPVPINFSRLHNPKYDLFWVAIAGPVANLIMALLWALVLKLLVYGNLYVSSYFGLMAQAGIAINISLMVINLLPILPLDGGRVVFSLLPNIWASKFAKIEPYGIWILMFLLIIGGITYIIQPIYSFMVSCILSLI